MNPITTFAWLSKCVVKPERVRGWQRVLLECKPKHESVRSITVLGTIATEPVVIRSVVARPPHSGSMTKIATLQVKADAVREVYRALNKHSYETG